MLCYVELYAIFQNIAFEITEITFKVTQNPAQILVMLQCHQVQWVDNKDREQGRGQGGLGTAKPSQPLKLAPPPNTTDIAPPHMSYHRKFLPVGVSVTHVPVLLSREH